MGYTVGQVCKLCLFRVIVAMNVFLRFFGIEIKTEVEVDESRMRHYIREKIVESKKRGKDYAYCYTLLKEEYEADEQKYGIPINGWERILRWEWERF